MAVVFAHVAARGVLLPEVGLLAYPGRKVATWPNVGETCAFSWQLSPPVCTWIADIGRCRVLGGLIVRYQYDAYGNVLGVAIGVLNPPATVILYTGQYFVVALLKYNLRARLYNPANGRFDTVDPLRGSRFYPITFHRYIYAGADPVDKVDPSGRGWFLNGALVVLAILVILLAIKLYRTYHHSSLDSGQQAIIDERQKEARVRLDHAYELLDDDARWPQTLKYFQQPKWKEYTLAQMILNNHEFYRSLLSKVREGLDTNPPNFLLANQSEEDIGSGEGGPAFVKESDHTTIYIRKPFWNQNPNEQTETVIHEYGRVYLWDELPVVQPNTKLGTVTNWDNMIDLLQTNYDDIIGQK